MTSARLPVPWPCAATRACSCVAREDWISWRSSDSARSGSSPRRSAAVRPRRITSRSRAKSRVARPVARLTAATCSLNVFRRATSARSSPSRSLSAARSSSRVIDGSVFIPSLFTQRAPLPQVRRRRYHGVMWTETLPDPLPADPLELAAQWLEQARLDAAQPNPNAMVLATADDNGQPSARVVLCKDIVPGSGYIIFYTNYQSRKGRELRKNPRAAIVFHWDHRHRQVRAEGRVEPLTRRKTTPIFARDPGKAASAPGRADKASRSHRAPSWARTSPPPRTASASPMAAPARKSPPTSPSRYPVRPTGAAFGSTSRRSSSGSKANSASTTVRVGHARGAPRRLAGPRPGYSLKAQTPWISFKDTRPPARIAGSAST